MKLYRLFETGSPVFSLEVFPPKREGPVEKIYKALDGLAALQPDYISVTYGAGGDRPGQTCEIASYIKDRLGIEPLAHITCINSGRGQVCAVLDRLQAAGVENLLALRGDRVPGGQPSADFRYAVDLMRLISSRYDFSFAGACYPEGHPDSVSLAADTESLRMKQQAGAKLLVTQMFFDTGVYFRFLDRARAAGVSLPVQPGVMPVVRKSQVERVVALSSASLPASFTRMIARYEQNPEGLYKAGVEYAVGQCLALLAGGAPGVHLYTMNDPRVAAQVYAAIAGALRREGEKGNGAEAGRAAGPAGSLPVSGLSAAGGGPAAAGAAGGR